MFLHVALGVHHDDEGDDDGGDAYHHDGVATYLALGACYPSVTLDDYMGESAVGRA
jgi:hypothetical protein